MLDSAENDVIEDKFALVDYEGFKTEVELVGTCLDSDIAVIINGNVLFTIENSRAAEFKESFQNLAKDFAI